MTKICVFTSTRADYGILSPLIRALHKDAAFELRLFVTGTHLNEAHGKTIQEIEGDGYLPFYKVSLDMTDDASVAHLKIMGESLVRFSEALAKDLPDAAIVLGDRYEALSFALASNGLGVPLIHLHGGEVTEGALDEAYRHCITKLSLIHFVAADTYAKRVIQMGEDPARVFNVGALGVDNILKTPLLSRDELSASLGFSFKKQVLAVTFHPETSSPNSVVSQIDELLKALDEKLMGGDVSMVITRANADHGNGLIHERIEKFVNSHADSCKYVSSLGMKRYLSLINISAAVIGNSSSGIIEAPAVGTPTVNIGDRQKGREMGKSIFNTRAQSTDILRAIDAAILYGQMKSGENMSIFGDGNASTKIMRILKLMTFSPFPKKSFYDLERSVK